MQWKLRVVCVLALALSTSCAITHPCQEAGDTSWNPPIVSSKKLCIQKEDKKTGKFVNHGQYREWHINGNLALEGMFDQGEKHGIWQQFNEEGKLRVEKVFDHGVELSAPSRKSSKAEAEEAQSQQDAEDREKRMKKQRK